MQFGVGRDLPNTNEGLHSALTNFGPMNQQVYDIPRLRGMGCAYIL